jgi:hypothetical protein
MENSGYLCLCQPPFIADLNGTCVQLPLSAQPTSAQQTPKSSTGKIFKLRSTLKMNQADIDFSSDLKNQLSDTYKKYATIVENLVENFYTQNFLQL